MSETRQSLLDVLCASRPRPIDAIVDDCAIDLQEWLDSTEQSGVTQESTNAEAWELERDRTIRELVRDLLDQVSRIRQITAYM